MPPIPVAPEIRFDRYVDRSGECWLWTGAILNNGYGRFSRGAKRDGFVSAHRWSYEFYRGPIPQGLQIDHLCRVRHCVNPAHMEPVSAQVNVLRGEGITAVNAVKTHCIHGHELSGTNLYVTGGHRQCRACKNQWQTAHRQGEKS